MNCQHQLHRGYDPRLLARRWFLQQCGVGLGSLALLDLLARDGVASPQAA